MDPQRPLEVDFSWKTFLKVLAFIALGWCLWTLSSLIVLVVFSVLIAVTLQPLRHKLTRAMPSWLATGLIALGLVASLAAICGILVPAVIAQISAVNDSWPKIKQDIFNSIPRSHLFQTTLSRLFADPGIVLGKELPKHLLSFGGMAIGGLSSLVLMLTLAVYFMVEGKGAVNWLLAFFNVEKRFKMHQTMRELSEVVSSYVGGQIITSLLVAVYAAILLTLLKVPGVLLLSILAGLLDVLPIVGFILSTLPAALLALTVSLRAAIILIAGYVAYHAIENYFIVPYVYGNKLRLSTLVVLLALLAGAMLGGIPGALLSLPIAAAYPIIERIWLGKVVGVDVIEKHSGGEEPKKRVG